MSVQLYNFETVLHALHREYISLSKKEIRRNNAILKRVVTKIEKGFLIDPLFSTYFNRTFYGGSYYDGLKVGNPEEFDLDLLLKVPEEGQPVLEHTNQPGYLSLKFNAPEALSKDFKKTMLDDKNYLSTSKVLNWMESIFTKALNKYRTPNGKLDFKATTYKLEDRVSKSGPAMTLILNGKDITINIDLVPCFEFSSRYWPKAGYTENPVPQKNTFFIVPKSPKDMHHAERYWRLSFQEQERQLIHDKRNLKPTLRVLKKLRDALEHIGIASYYIKTIFLLENERNGDCFWNGSMTNAFFKMFDIYIQYIESGKIPYFWNRKNNLLNLSPATLKNMQNHLRTVYKNMLTNYKTNPKIICEYLDVDI